MERLEGKVAVITGAASGIGRGTALALTRRGVAITVADIDGEGAERVVAEIASAGGEAMAVQGDVTDDRYFEELRDRTLERFGNIHIVMNNAGGITRGLPEHVPLAEWQRILDTNLLSLVRSNLAFLTHLIAQGEGHIVNTASFAGLMTYAFDRLPYSATKAAVIQISEGLAIYLRPKGVGVTVLCPGPVKTNIMSGLRAFGPPTETRGPGPGFALLEAEDVGEQVVAAIETNRFMLPTHEHVRELLMSRAQDWDGFIDHQIAHPHVVARPD